MRRHNFLLVAVFATAAVRGAIASADNPGPGERPRGPGGGGGMGPGRGCGGGPGCGPGGGQPFPSEGAHKATRMSPALREAFKEVLGRDPTGDEEAYWRTRIARGDPNIPERTVLTHDVTLLTAYIEWARRENHYRAAVLRALQSVAGPGVEIPEARVNEILGGAIGRRPMDVKLSHPTYSQIVGIARGALQDLANVFMARHSKEFKDCDEARAHLFTEGRSVYTAAVRAVLTEPTRGWLSLLNNTALGHTEKLRSHADVASEVAGCETKRIVVGGLAKAFAQYLSWGGNLGQPSRVMDFLYRPTLPPFTTALAAFRAGKVTPKTVDGVATWISKNRSSFMTSTGFGALLDQIRGDVVAALLDAFADEVKRAPTIRAYLTDEKGQPFQNTMAVSGMTAEALRVHLRNVRAKFLVSWGIGKRVEADERATVRAALREGFRDLLKAYPPLERFVLDENRPPFEAALRDLRSPVEGLTISHISKQVL